VPVDRIDDDELVYLRVPPVTPWFEPPDQVSTANFKLDQRRGDLGLSVYRASVVRPQDVLAKPDAIPGSRVTQARVGDIRALVNGQNQPLNLDVIVVDDRMTLGTPKSAGRLQGDLPRRLPRRSAIYLS
jgi:hypothetical protein